MIRVALVWLGVSTIFGQTAAVADLRYRVHFIGDLPGGAYGSSAIDINAIGQVCGLSIVQDLGGDDGFFWDPTSLEMTRLPTLPGCGPFSYPEGMNDLGFVTGTTGCDGARAFLWSLGSGIVALGQQPGGYSHNYATGLNNSNQVTGYGRLPNGTDIAFVWDVNDGMIPLGDLPGGFTNSIGHAINDSGWVCGSSGTDFCYEPFLWTPMGGMVALGDIAGGTFCGEAFALNNLGQVVGATYITSEYFQAYRWDAVNGPVGLGRLGDDASYACDINDHGTVVGYCLDTDRFRIGFVWDAAHGMRDLDLLIDPCLPHLPHLAAWAINNAGQIAADGRVDALVLTPYLPGDLDEDGDIGIDDLARMLGSFGRSGDAVYTDGDLDCDADVDLRDLTTLLSGFGQALHP